MVYSKPDYRKPGYYNVHRKPDYRKLGYSNRVIQATITGRGVSALGSGWRTLGRAWRERHLVEDWRDLQHRQ